MKKSVRYVGIVIFLAIAISSAVHIGEHVEFLSVYPIHPSTDGLDNCDGQCNAGAAVGDVRWEENLSSIPDQSTPILDLGIPGLNKDDILNVTDITGGSSGWVDSIPFSWAWILLGLIAITGVGSAIAYFFESRKAKPEIHEEIKPEISQEPVIENPDEQKIIELIERANSFVFIDPDAAQRLYNEINTLYDKLPNGKKSLYIKKISVLYDKIMLELKKEQVERALKVKHVRKAELLMAETEELYEKIRENEPERKIPRLTTGAQKEYELSINKLHELITAAKQDLVNQDLESAKKKCSQIIWLFQTLPENIKSKVRFEVIKLYETLKNS
jgi:hypothetical protein